MKIKKFNQLNEKSVNLNNFKPDEKLLEVTFNGKFYVSLKDIENMNIYYTYLNEYNENTSTARFYALEEHISDTGKIVNHYDYKLMDGTGTYITNEEEYDNAKKYNL